MTEMVFRRRGPIGRTKVTVQSAGIKVVTAGILKLLETESMTNYELYECLNVSGTATFSQVITALLNLRKSGQVEPVGRARYAGHVRDLYGITTDDE